MNELFGYTNIMTNEWTDGIAAKIIRDNVTESTDLKKWIVFDGPVDALWIENMNTVLDDNKVSCFPLSSLINDLTFSPHHLDALPE